MRGLGWVVAIALVSGCTFTRSLDYLTSGNGETHDAGTTDATTPPPPSNDAATPSTNPLPSDVTPEAVVLAGDLYVAGKRGTHGWVGRFDEATLALKGSADIDLTGAAATTLLAIADGGNGTLLLGGSGDASAIVGSIASDLTAPAVHALTAPVAGNAFIHHVAAANGITWAAGTVTDATNTVLTAWISAGDVQCPTPDSPNSTAPVVRIDLVGGTEMIAFVTRADHDVTYPRYAGTDCTRSAFPQGGLDNDVTVVTTPSMFTMAANGTSFYGAGTMNADAGTFFIQYDRTTGRRPNNDGVDSFTNQVSTILGSAHDGDALYVVGTFAGAESVLAVGSLGQIAMGQQPRSLKIEGYSARGIDVEPTGKPGFFLVGGSDHGYVVRCDKTNGCPATAP